MKLLRFCALLIVLSILCVLPALAAEPGDYGYYDANFDGKIEITDALTSLCDLLNDPESERNLLQVLRTVKTVTTSEPVEATLLSVDTEAGTVTLSCDKLESFAVPFATLGLTADSDFDALVNQSVNLTVPAPAADFFADYDAGNLLAGRPVPLIETEEPETPAAAAVTDITFSPSGTYLKFTITPPADETGISKYEVLFCEEGNENGRIGWPVNAEYCEYVGLERFLSDVDYDTVTVYAKDAVGNVLSEYTESMSVTHTDATVNIEAAYYEQNGGYGGVFFSEALPSAYVLSFYNTNGDKLAFQNRLDAGTNVSDLYEYDDYSLFSVRSVQIESSKSVTVGEENALNITTVGSNRVTLEAYPEERCLGAASNPHIDEFGCITWDVPADLPEGSVSYAYLRNEDGDWIDPGFCTTDHTYAPDAFPAGNYDMILIYTIPTGETQALYGYGTYRSTFVLTIGDPESGEEESTALPAVTDVAFTEDSYYGLRVTFTEADCSISPKYALYLHNGTDWVGPLARTGLTHFDLVETDLVSGTYSKLKIVTTTDLDGYTDGVYETDCSLTVSVTEGTASMLFTPVTTDEDHFCYLSGLPAKTRVQVYWSESPSVLDQKSKWGLYTDATGACLYQYGAVDLDMYYRIRTGATCTLTDASTATLAFTTYGDWTKATETIPTENNALLSSAGFMAVNGIPAFAFTPASADDWWESAVSFSADGGETWVGQHIFTSTSVALSNKNWTTLSTETTYDKVRVTAFANGGVQEYVADCSFTVTPVDGYTLPTPKIVYDESNAAYTILIEGGCPANTGYTYICVNSDGTGVSGGGSNPTDTAADITIGEYLSTPEEFADYTVHVRLLRNVVMDGMTCTADLYNSGKVPVIAE